MLGGEATDGLHDWRLWDNDGDDDLLVTASAQLVLYRNQGDGTFEDVTAFRRLWPRTGGRQPLGLADLDGDRRSRPRGGHYVEIRAMTIILHAAIIPGGRFTVRPDDIRPTGPALSQQWQRHILGGEPRGGLFTGPDGRGLGMASLISTADGNSIFSWPTSASRNFLFRNLGEFRFEEIGESAGVGFNGSGRATAEHGSGCRRPRWRWAD